MEVPVRRTVRYIRARPTLAHFVADTIVSVLPTLAFEPSKQDLERRVVKKTSSPQSSYLSLEQVKGHLNGTTMKARSAIDQWVNLLWTIACDQALHIFVVGFAIGLMV